jgi:radical SAM-linked protein
VSFWVVTFGRTGGARYLSHLDTARALQRTFARAGIPVSLSQGMRPKPRFSLPLPLPVGAAGREELAVVEVADDAPAPAEALARLRDAAPPGLLPAIVLDAGQGHPRPRARAADYTCLLDGEAGAIAAAVERYGREAHVIHERVSPKGRRDVDLKEYVERVTAEPVPSGALLRFTVRYRDDGAARPQELVDLIALWAGVEPVMRALERQRIAWQGSLPGFSRGAERSVAT